MFLAFFSPMEVEHSQHEFVMFKLMQAFPPEALVIMAPNFFFRAPSEIPANRYCTDAMAQKVRNFSVPSHEKLNSYKRLIIPDNLVEQIIVTDGGNIDASFSFIQEYESSLLRRWLVAQFEALIASTGQVPEAIIVWRDCQSLKSVAAQFGIRIIHNEYSVYREPEYRDRIIFDFSGFKATTELHDRYVSALNERDFPWERLERLAEDNFPDLLSQQTHKSAIGVLLGVEWDTAFTAEETNLSLIRKAEEYAQGARLIVRPHPIGSKCQYGPHEYDYSPDLTFMTGTCSSVLTLFSGAAVEMVAGGLDVKFLGCTPLNFLDFSGLPAAERMRRFSFFYYCYLVPGDKLFDIDYYRWRLGSPREKDIFHIHLGNETCNGAN